jgi:hypothetical protein
VHGGTIRQHRLRQGEAAMEIGFNALLSIALGVGLAAATGFRVFLPLLVASLAARSGALPLSDGFAWLASTPALVTLGTAAVLETLAYYIPGVDHVLDVIASPATLAAGVIASAAVMADVPPAVMAGCDHRGRWRRGSDQGQRGDRACESGLSRAVSAIRW